MSLYIIINDLFPKANEFKGLCQLLKELTFNPDKPLSLCRLS